jgi:hypothetical protein
VESDHREVMAESVLQVEMVKDHREAARVRAINDRKKDYY